MKLWKLIWQNRELETYPSKGKDMENLGYIWGVVWGWKWENFLKGCIRRIRNPDSLPHLMKPGNCPPSHPDMLVYFLKMLNHKIVHTWTPAEWRVKVKLFWKERVKYKFAHWTLSPSTGLPAHYPTPSPIKCTSQREISLILTFEVSFPKWSPSQNDHLVRSTIFLTSPYHSILAPSYSGCYSVSPRFPPQDHKLVLPTAGSVSG